MNDKYRKLTDENDAENISIPSAETRPCIIRISRWIFSKILDYSYFIPALICLIIGGNFGFKWALLASAIVSVISVLVSFILYKSLSPESEFHPTVFPKLFDVFNPFFFAILTPIGWWQGDEFCRLWVGTINAGLLAFVVLVSILIRRPWLSESIPLPEDEREHPMYIAIRYWLTAAIGLIFLVMFISNLVVAVYGLEFGTAFVEFLYVTEIQYIVSCCMLCVQILFQFVIPYGVLSVGIASLRYLGKYVWIRTCKKVYGDQWMQIAAEIHSSEKEESQGQGQDTANTDDDQSL